MRHLKWSFLLALVLPACGGGGSEPGGSLSAEPQTMVVEYDQDDDGAPDWVTLDTSTHPFRIVEAIHGSNGGEPIDLTAVFAGTPIDPALSEALAEHLAHSFDEEERTELEVALEGGRRITVAVLD